MTLQQLRVLVAVVEAGSFTHGARTVHMTQSAASQHVRSLEQALGVPLVERTAGAVLATRAGEGLVRYARDMLRTAADAERYVGAVRQGRAGRLMLGASGSAVALIPALAAAVRAATADVELALRVAPRPEIEAAVAQGAVDVAVLSGPVRRAGIEVQTLCPDRLVLVAAPGSPWQPGRAPLVPLPLPRLAEQPLIAPEATSHAWRQISLWAEREEVELRPALRLESADAIKRAVEAGLGVALLSAWVVEREVAQGTLRLVPVVPAPPLRRYELARRAGREVDGVLAALLHAAPEYLRRRLPAGIAGGPPGASP